MSSEPVEPVADVDAREAAHVGCTATEHVSLADHENAIPAIREIVVANASDQDLRFAAYAKSRCSAAYLSDSIG